MHQKFQTFHCRFFEIPQFFFISGSAFCPSINQSRVSARIFYKDLTIKNIEEVEAFPFDELANELVGIAGIYFGFSAITVALLITAGIHAIRAICAKHRIWILTPMWSALPSLIK